MIFVYAIIFGIINPTKEENLFTTGLFWGLFWPFFMVVTLGSFGKIFCGICPKAFLGKYITKIGLNKKIPKSLNNPFIGLMILFIGWWLVYYMFPFVDGSIFMAILFLSQNSFTIERPKPKPCLEESSWKNLSKIINKFFVSISFPVL